MILEKLSFEGFKCQRCGHEWKPLKPDKKPRVCPKCKSAYWDVPRKIKKEKEK